MVQALLVKALSRGWGMVRVGDGEGGVVCFIRMSFVGASNSATLSSYEGFKFCI